MRYDIYLIILTGFAVFGIYCFFDVLITFFTLKNIPVSVLIMKTGADCKTMQKIKIAEQNIPNNHIVFYPFETDHDKTLFYYLKDVLYVNNW